MGDWKAPLFNITRLERHCYDTMQLIFSGNYCQTYFCFLTGKGISIPMEDLPTQIETRKRTCSTEGPEIWYSAFLKVARYSYTRVPVKISTILMLPSVRRLAINIVTKLLALFVKGESVSMHISPYSIFLCCIYKQSIMNVIVKQKKIIQQC